MEILYYNEAYSSELLELVNSHITHIPPYTEVSLSEFSTILNNPHHMSDRYYGSFNRDIVTIVSRVEGKLSAAAQLTFPVRGKPDDGTEAIVNWFFADNNMERDTDCFFKNVLYLVKEKGYQKLSFSRNSFGAGWSGIPATWPHLLRVILNAGYSDVQIWDSYWKTAESTEEQDIMPLLDVKVINQTAELQVHFHFYKEEMDIGEVAVWFPSELATHLRRDGIANIEWIGVSEGFQGKRFGEKMLRYASSYCARQGFPNLMLWTMSENMRKLAKRTGYQAGPRFHWITISVQADGS